MKGKYRIPTSKIKESLRECLYSALNLWQAGTYTQEKGGLHVAVGLWILGIEEVGKYVLIKEAADEHGTTGTFDIPLDDFKNHRLKVRKGQELFREWGIDLKSAGVALTEETKEALWYVAWDNQTQTFKRDFSSLEPQPITRVALLGELMRVGIVKMNELLGTTSQ